jgi:hypothetical protein
VVLTEDTDGSTTFKWILRKEDVRVWIEFQQLSVRSETSTRKHDNGNTGLIKGAELPHYLDDYQLVNQHCVACRYATMLEFRGYRIYVFSWDFNSECAWLVWPYPWFQASAAVLMRSALFWGVTQHRMVILYRRFGTCRSHLQGSRSPRFRVTCASYIVKGCIINTFDSFYNVKLSTQFMKNWSNRELKCHFRLEWCSL